LRSAPAPTRHASILDDTDFQPLRDEAQNALVRDPVLEEAENPVVAHGIKGSIATLPITAIIRAK
jgi:hypothetical protein